MSVTSVIGRPLVAAAFVFSSIIAALPAATAAESAELAFPGAVGWAKHTPGGRGGQIIRVTNLNTDGPGSFAEAVQTKGPRIIVFEVGGVIDLGQKTLRVEEPYLTIAGQTAPSPGITLIKGGIDIATHDVVVRHLRVRPGWAGAEQFSGVDFDSISNFGASNVIVDHCTLTWATDENLSASGKRFIGDTPDEWRKSASHSITFSNNIIAEGLANATHGKFEHSKGSLIHDNVANVLIYRNLYAHNYERNPHLKGGVHAAVVNNIIYDPGQRAIHYNLMEEEWRGYEYQDGLLSAVGNVMRAGPSTAPKIAFLMIGGYGDLRYYGKDNVAVDRIGEPLPMIGRYTMSSAKVIEVKKPPVWPEGLEVMPTDELERSVLADVGARPWDRDVQDRRIIMNAGEGRGKIIDRETEVGGYPMMPETRRPFNPDDWDLATMEPKNPAVLDHSYTAKGT